MSSSRPVAGFLLRVTIAHVVTYFVVGLIAAAVIDYADLFTQPVIRDFMRPFGSVAVIVGPLLQVVRGLLIAAVLLPFRAVIAAGRGWLWLWLLFLGIGILSTPAAAPGSLEGAVYSQLPWWYHLLGMPEMLVQTLAFSALVHLIARHPTGVFAALPPVFERILRALVVACFSFIGYAAVSVVFALAVGAPIGAAENLSPAVQGIFVLPFLVNGVIAFFAAAEHAPRRRLAAAAISYGAGAISILSYQAIVFGSADLVYGLVAPVLPAVILWLVTAHRRGSGSVPTDADVESAQHARPAR
ncbi:hypothetical protein [Microbacterium sp. SLBN-146]|uniref:hypothetical protein n=1 Tax=Microbacterium sp. SLBN-146 TaxID=2768457 RepID=UPI00114DF334|nr:hypothetical protein [Microbacterium sp. SLBN-146]TQJ30632.1 hypothetical protein FBY39_1085 [Microbacterium sp. SLBN-146]